MEKKYLLKILILVIVVLLIIFGIKILNKPKGQKEVSLEEINALLEKGDSITNYKCEVDSNGVKTIIQHKDKKEKIEASTADQTKVIVYNDYEKEEGILLSEEKKTAIKYNNILDDTHVLKKQKEELDEVLKKCKTGEYSYKYIGEEKIRNEDCIVIEISFEYQTNGGYDFNGELSKYNGETITNKIWINKEHGVIEKIENNFSNIKTTAEFNYEYNNVTDEDVQLPDLSDYNFIEV